MVLKFGWRWGKIKLVFLLLFKIMLWFDWVVVINVVGLVLVFKILFLWWWVKCFIVLEVCIGIIMVFLGEVVNIICIIKVVSSFFWMGRFFLFIRVSCLLLVEICIFKLVCRVDIICFNWLSKIFFFLLEMVVCCRLVLSIIVL